MLLKQLVSPKDSAVRRPQADLRRTGFLLLSMILTRLAVTQTEEITYAERLGWPSGTKVVIFHVDDAGMSHNSNMGAIKAVEEGIATSLSIMMPCSWVPEYANYLKANPKTDAGIHLTLTSEWKNYRWGPVAGKPAVPGLTDTDGYLWHNVSDVAAHAAPDEVETEIRAQIDKALSMGIVPTHLDAHMGTCFHPLFIDRYVKVGIEKKIPVLIFGGHMQHLGNEAGPLRPLVLSIAERVWKAGLPVIDDLVTRPTSAKDYEKKKGELIKLLRDMKPGITQIIVHCTVQTEVFSHISGSGPNREAELRLLTDPDIKAFIESEGIVLTTWRELKKRRALTQTPLVTVADLNVGESQTVQLHDGSQAAIKLLDLKETRDNICNAVRRAVVKVEVNGQTVSLVSSTYHLPITVAGVQLDCPVTKGYLQKSSKENPWGLTKDARLRLWPAGSPWIKPGTFIYPAKQKWFASDTQMANVPVFVDGGEVPSNKNIYYHYGLDFGGAEGLVDVIAATNGLVVAAGLEKLPGYEPANGGFKSEPSVAGSPVTPRYDVIYILDDRGWFYRYSHLYEIDSSVKPGQYVEMGQKIGILGKEGGSGGWSHLHFDIKCRQPSGMWGIQNGYAFIWQVYQREYQPKIIAVARPHHVAWTGEVVELDATRSWSRYGTIKKFEWSFCDGTLAPKGVPKRTTGPKVRRTYDKPGEYNEILKVTDASGNIDYDFAVVQIIDKNHPDQLPPAIHAAYYPTFDIKPGDEITFKVRSFRTTYGSEVWDFGDGSTKVTVQSDGNVQVHNPQGYAVTTHRYKKPGHYIASVKRSNERGHEAITHLHINVGNSN
ncbi:MAG: ChbG/HpnK family deacetylase [Planctomycetota bacterium]